MESCAEFYTQQHHERENPVVDENPTHRSKPGSDRVAVHSQEFVDTSFGHSVAFDGFRGRFLFGFLGRIHLRGSLGDDERRRLLDRVDGESRNADGDEEEGEEDDESEHDYMLRSALRRAREKERRKRRGGGTERWRSKEKRSSDCAGDGGPGKFGGTRREQFLGLFSRSRGNGTPTIAAVYA